MSGLPSWRWADTPETGPRGTIWVVQVPSLEQAMNRWRMTGGDIPIGDPMGRSEDHLQFFLNIDWSTRDNLIVAAFIVPPGSYRQKKFPVPSSFDWESPALFDRLMRRYERHIMSEVSWGAWKLVMDHDRGWNTQRLRLLFDAERLSEHIKNVRRCDG